jgi:hypothetical protein
VAEQLFDSAMVYAGMQDDPRPMLIRVNALMEKALGV